MRKTLITVASLLLFGFLVFFGLTKTAFGPGADQRKQDTKTKPTEFDKKKLSNTDPVSLWVVVNKQHSLDPTSYTPGDLVVPDVPLRLARAEEQMQIRKVAEQPIKTMFSDAKKAGINLTFGSGFRSYTYQKVLYDGYIRSMGQAEADRTSARPGHSEHQTGLAFDVTLPSGKCHLDTCLGDLPEGKWVAANAYKYGFIIRYTKSKENVTGYGYEPWHLRYVGVELAAELDKQNVQTLEEFFGITGGKEY